MTVQGQGEEEEDDDEEIEGVGKGPAICPSPVTNVHFALSAEVRDARPTHLPVCKGRKYSFGIGGGAGGGHSRSAAAAK